MTGDPSERSPFAGVENARPPLLLLLGSPSLQRVLILNPKAARIEAKHLPMLVQRTGGATSRTGSREEFSTLQAAREAHERDYILKELDRTHGNISRAAEALGLERSHLYRKLKALGIHLGE